MATACQDAEVPKLVAPQSPSADEVEGDDVSIQSNHWLTLPSLSSVRAGHSTIKFNSCIWSLGGQAADPAPPTHAVETYCPSADPNSWNAGPSLPEARTRFAGVGVIAKRIYAAGGLDGTGRARNTLYVYDAATGWTLVPEPMPVVACGGGGAVVNGKLYIYANSPVADAVEPDPIGCDATNKQVMVFAVYDPAKVAPPRWQLLPLLQDQYSGFRCDHSVVGMGASIYLVGGSSCDLAMPFPGVNAFNTTTGQWLPPTRAMANTPHEGGVGQAAIALNNRIFMIGGYNGNLWYNPSSEVHVYDLATDSWDQLRPRQATREHASVAVLATKITLAGGGSTSDFNGATASAEHINVPAGCDVHEPDGTVAKASPWTLRTDLDGQLVFPYLMTQARLCAAGDVDLFAVLPSDYTGVSFHIEMTPPAGRDYQLQLLTPNGQTVVATSAKPGSATESILYPANVGSGYLIRVKTQGGSFDKVHPYRLEVMP